MKINNIKFIRTKQWNMRNIFMLFDKIYLITLFIVCRTTRTIIYYLLPRRRIHLHRRLIFTRLQPPLFQLLVINFLSMKFVFAYHFQFCLIVYQDRHPKCIGRNEWNDALTESLWWNEVVFTFNLLKWNSYRINIHINQYRHH